MPRYNKKGFHIDLRIGKLDDDNVHGNSVGLFVGTKTAFNQLFELMTKFGLTNVDNVHHDDDDKVIFYPDIAKNQPNRKTPKHKYVLILS